MKVLLIMADGMRPDAIENLPLAQEMMKKSTYTLKGSTVMPSITLPCHLSLFLSVDPERHGTTTNVYAPQVRPIEGLCEMLDRAKKTCAFFYNWDEFRDLTRPGSLSYAKYISGAKEGWENSTVRLVDDAIDYINTYNPDFAFLYTGWPDETGHAHCWMSPEYLESVEKSWQEMTRLMENVPEEYTVIVTTDHGGHGRSHGTEMPEDMVIPVMIKGEDFAAGKEFDRPVNIKDIAPTITELLQAEPAPEWEGKSLVSKMG